MEIRSERVGDKVYVVMEIDAKTEGRVFTALAKMVRYRGEPGYRYCQLATAVSKKLEYAERGNSYRNPKGLLDLGLTLEGLEGSKKKLTLPACDCSDSCCGRADCCRCEDEEEDDG
jgi:hypothetical protein